MDFSGLADSTKEYLLGVIMGAAAGSELEIFQWVDNSFKKIAEVSYHKFFLVNGNKKIGITVWQIYFGDSNLVDFF